MSLIYCPECGHEISNAAVACPNCGRPIHARPAIERNVVVAERPRESEGFPAWAFVPIGILGAVLLFGLFYLMSGDDSQTNVNVNMSARRASTNSLDTSSLDSQTTTVPPATGGETVTLPSGETQTVTVPGSQSSVSSAPPDKGTVVIDAKIATRTGVPQAVRNERFYLLDEDLESILADAGLEPIEGQSMLNSFGLSVMYPERYGEFNRNAMNAIKNHIKYAGTTDSTGKAQLGGIEPNSYYLFGVTKAGRGFAVWSSPVAINAGENILNLTPRRLTEIEMSSGD